MIVNGDIEKTQFGRGKDKSKTATNFDTKSLSQKLYLIITEDQDLINIP